MWRITVCRLWLASTSLCLRGTSRTGEEDKRDPNACDSASPARGAARASRPASEGTRTWAAASASPAVDAPESSSALSALTHAVDQLRELTRRTQHTLCAQEEATRLMQQELLLLTRRVAQMESTADRLQGKLTEVHRAIGEAVLSQRNTDLLVQQMERRQLADSAGRQVDAGSRRKGEDAPSLAVSLSDACVSPSTSVNGSASPTPAPHAATKIAPATPSPSAALAEQVATLEARLDQLTANIFAADRLGAVVDRMAVSGVDTENVAASVLSAGNQLSRASLLQHLQRRCALSTFIDAAGVTRLSSHVVRVHNVPLNMGAMEVRELCVQHVCKGKNANELVSCMVHRSSGSIPAAATVAAAAAGHARRPVQEGAHSPKVASTPQYLSAETTSKFSTASTASADVAAMGDLPRGDTVAAIRPNTKTLEVVFTSASTAVRALKVLNGMQLRPTLHETPLPLVVEPVVSADVLAALKAWEDEAGATTQHVT
ncbi:hypothetical protein GH5_06794 [Leishmania sp. Ghana 2012 LV757]|uniref:hypothetical protein n=1 Tax=Leishmania sp. Ghana 2012 LV757 TaxID=2803181 RepID=UPI001B465D0F|nr:hypothetical protein GH5_06794 [Leishmania sp. Ghana 2012 LV757]